MSTKNSAGLAAAHGVPHNPRIGFPSFWSPNHCSHDSWYHGGNAPRVTPGNDPALDYRSHESRPPHLDTTAASSGTLRGGPKGGPIISLHASDCNRLTRELRTSRYDLATLAHSWYHGGVDGMLELTIKFIHECGNNSLTTKAPKDVLIYYNDIVLVHRKVITGWTNYHTGRSGPLVEYIVKKLLLNFPRLHSLDAKDAVDFYDRLQKLSSGYLLPLMPFDTIKLSFNFEGLCPPGLGMMRYAEVGSALMEILPRLLPATTSDVRSAIASVGFESNNGYEFFWRILELMVPGFDPMVPILPPTWHRDSDVFDFCHAYLLYFRLQAKKNNYFDAPTHTSIFLCAIAFSDYVDIVTLLQAQVNAYHNPDDDGYLPHHLRLSGIATLINFNAKAHVRDFASPHIHRAVSMGDDWDAVNEEELPYCHVQGYSPHDLHLEQGRGRADQGHDRDCDCGLNKGRHELDQCHGFGLRDRGHSGGQQGTCGLIGGRNGNPPQGHSLCPDQRRQPFLHGVICATCKCTGHEATSCNTLAIALFVDCHKDQLSESKKSSIEEKWIAQWKDKVGQPTLTPRQVMRAYCKELDILAKHLVKAMDWECCPPYDDVAVDNK